ncbi:hypothetical protein A3E14_03585 [Candidatus Curtissbacteria bacterium RIFCSPHIGHO2_12_FULL_41_13]|nr:MAG: hypothetical protein A3E14_03585 [Candidatus Curtissbacteria bacterium RIFCSPHIGHO2_12_FULL_41_13]
MDIPVLPVDFENKQAAHFWKWARDIIKSSRRRQSGQNFKKLLTNLPKELSGFVDTLYLVSVSPAFSEKERWVQELVKVAKRIKQKSLKRQLSAIAHQLKIAQEKNLNRELTSLTKKFDKLTENLEKMNI